MDPSAPQTVLKGVAATSSLCAILGGLYGGLKHGAPSKFFVYSAVNSGIAAATFFCIREYAVSPVLVLALPGRQYQRRRQKLLSYLTGDSALQEPVTLSWTDIRTLQLLDSGISGAFAGAILNARKRGRRGLLPGLTTGALMCTLFQWCFNELNISRIRYVSFAPLWHTTHLSIDASQSPSTEPSIPTAMQPTPVETSTYRSPMDRVLSVFGQRMSDETYLERLRMERDSHLRRIAELEGKRKP